MRKFGWKVLCVLGCGMLLCTGCSKEKEEVWTSAEYVEQDWEEVIPMLALLQENQELLAEQDSEKTTFDLQQEKQSVWIEQEHVMQEAMQPVTVEMLEYKTEDASKEMTEEELMLFASEPTRYEGERSEEVRIRQEQKIQEAKEKRQFIKENIITPLTERYEKQIKEHLANGEVEEELIKVHWSYDYMQDMTNKEKELYTIYLTAVNMQYDADENATALPWCDIYLTVEMLEDGLMIRKGEASWDYNIVLEFREDGSMVIRRNQ